MAAGRLPSPGTAFGPCEKECKHLDCQMTKSMANSTCHYCSCSIGYENRFYQIERNGLRVLVHADCHEEAIESEAEPSA